MNEEKRDAATTWQALEDQAMQAEIDETLAMSDEELDRFIDENGGNARAIRASGKALAEELTERRTRLAWHAAMEDKLQAFRKTAATRKKKSGKLSRAELLARIEVARNNPVFTTPVAMLFQKKTSEASTDQELEAVLDAIELLTKALPE